MEYLRRALQDSRERLPFQKPVSIFWDLHMLRPAFQEKVTSFDNEQQYPLATA